jgi:hypothetical protein
MADRIWLDALIDADTRADVEQHAADAADKDMALRRLTAGLPLLRDAVARAVFACLHVDPLATLADAWCTADDLKGYRDTMRGDKPVVLKLAGHSIERDIRPVVDIDAQRFELGMAVTLGGAFEGVELSILKGRLISVGSGTCSLSLRLKAGDHAQTPWKTLASLQLPAEYRFMQPLKIY